MLKENSRKVYDYVKANDGKNMTAADIAEATGLEVRSVNGIIGTHKSIKLVSLTDAGREFDPDAEETK